MSRPLVIVESPAKAKTVARHLGDGYDVRASVGHIADLPTKGLGVDVDNGFKPQWELTQRGKDVVKELRTNGDQIGALAKSIGTTGTARLIGSLAFGMGGPGRGPRGFGPPSGR